MKSKICLIRHGITEGNKRRLYYGHSDIDLAPEGVEELKAQVASGLYPDGEDADFYTTDLKRTQQTLKLIYGDREFTPLSGLKEINFGDFEMRTYQELKDLEEYQEWLRNPKDDTLAPPNGESIRDFYDRIDAGFDDLLNRHALKVLKMRHSVREALSIVVCHGGTISAVMEKIFPGEKDNFYQWIPDPGHGYMLTLEDGAVVDAEKF
ncbi:MAG: histidine phosphatase family protein [Bacillota bacterium]|nr:histidine phosphatase family protein [Bacillota bacterium]